MADVRHRSRLGSEHNTTWANCPERTTAMFGRLMIEPVVQVDPTIDLHTSVAALIKVTENVEIFSRPFFKVRNTQRTVPGTPFSSCGSNSHLMDGVLFSSHGVPFSSHASTHTFLSFFFCGFRKL